LKTLLLGLCILISTVSHAGVVDDFFEWANGPYSTESLELFEELYPNCNYHGKEVMQGALNPYYHELFTISLYGNFDSVEAARETQKAHKMRYNGLDLQIIKSDNVYKLILNSCPKTETQSTLDAVEIRNLSFEEDITLIKILERD